MTKTTQTKVAERHMGSRVFKNGEVASRVYGSDEEADEVRDKLRGEDPSGSYTICRYTKVGYMVVEAKGDDDV